MQTPPVTPDATAPMTVSQALGEITWLISRSPHHRQLFVSDLEWFAMPAILLEQFRIYRGDGQPAAVAFWAWVSDETQARLISEGGRLRPDEWKSGSNPWVVEIVAPFGETDAILADLSQNVFPGRRFKFHRVGEGRRLEVAEFGQAERAEAE